MRFSTISSFIFASVAALVSAQGPSTQNAFTAPIAGDTLTAGQPFTLKWNNHVSDTVTLSLRSGNVNDLTQQTIIARKSLLPKIVTESRTNIKCSQRIFPTLVPTHGMSHQQSSMAQTTQLLLHGELVAQIKSTSPLDSF